MDTIVIICYIGFAVLYFTSPTLGHWYGKWYYRKSREKEGRNV